MLLRFKRSIWVLLQSIFVFGQTTVSSVEGWLRSAEEEKRLIVAAPDGIMKISPIDDLEKAHDDKLVKKLHATTTDEILTEIGLLNPHSIFMILSMAFLWFLSAMPTMSPAYMSPPTSACGENCTFQTVQKEFDLQQSLFDPGEMTSSVYFLGNLMLGQMYCMAADRMGRRPVLVWSLIVSGIAGVVSAFSPTFYLMLLGRFVQGSFFNSITMVNWVMCCESIAFKGHSYASVLFGIFWVAGYCVVTPIALLLPSWRAVQFVTSIPTLLFGVVMLVLLPESFGFLVTKKKLYEAEAWIRRSHRWGGRRIECDVQKTIENETARVSDEKSLRESLYHVFHDSTLLLYMGIQTVLWVVDFMVYNALSLTSTDVIKGDANTSFVFSGLVELPCYFLMPIALDRLGRRPTVVLSHLLSAAALSFMCFLNAEDDPTTYLIVWLIAKFGMASAFMCCFVYGSEIFPVQYRNICLGFCATLSNVGAMLSPHCNVLDHFFSGGLNVSDVPYHLKKNFDENKLILPASREFGEQFYTNVTTQAFSAVIRSLTQERIKLVPRKARFKAEGCFGATRNFDDEAKCFVELLEMVRQVKQRRRHKVLRRVGARLVVSATGSEVGNKTVRILSPRIGSAGRDENKEVSVLSPNIALNTNSGDTEKDALLELLLEVSGATHGMREALDRLKANETPAMTKADVEKTLGKKERQKIDVIQAMEKTYSAKQMESFKNRGFAFMTGYQRRLVYGKASPYHDEVVLRRTRGLQPAQLERKLINLIRLEAMGKSDYNRRMKYDLINAPTINSVFVNAPLTNVNSIFSPVLLSAFITSPTLVGPLILSPWLLSTLVASPWALCPIILSPFTFVPIILSPVAMSPFVLSPGVFSPAILSPLLMVPYILSPGVFNPLILSPLLLSPLVLSPTAAAPVILSPALLAPVVLSPLYHSAVVLSPSLLSPPIGSDGANVAIILSPDLGML
ncbi:hypothetical protein Q1695_005309 [Nippostrongylus brasiliensis]|nr:hypothetical protein Q1695_005309 [Nippostrongylus brasiliensis]